MARRHGYSEEQIQPLADFEPRNDFTPQEKVALRFAERMTRDAHNVDDALWSELRSHFSEGDVVELAATIGMFNYFNRFNDALQMESSQ